MNDSHINVCSTHAYWGTDLERPVVYDVCLEQYNVLRRGLLRDLDQMR